MLKMLSKFLSSNVRNAGLLFLFSGLANGLGYLFNTIVAQKLTVNDFGSFRLLVDTVGVLFPCLLFGFQYTWTRKIISADVDEQNRLKAGALVIVSMVACVATFFIYVLTYFLSQIFIIGFYVILVPFAFIISVPLFKDLVTGLLTAQKKVYLLCLQFIAPQLLSIVLVFTKSEIISVHYIVSVFVVSNLICGLFLLCLSKLSFNKITVTVKLLVSENKKIGLPIYLSSYLSMASLNIIQFLSGYYLSASEYANLSMAFMLSGILGLVTAAVGMIKTQDFAKEVKISRKVTIGTMIASLLAGLIAISVAILVKIFMLSTDFNLMLFLIPFLMVSALFQGQSYIINRFLLSKDMAKQMSRISAFTGIIGIVASVILIPLFGVWGSVCTQIAVSFSNFILNTRAYRSIVNKVITA